MKTELEANWGLSSAQVLYDRPPASFRRATQGEKFFDIACLLIFLFNTYLRDC
jgi:hypothetical protein